MDIHRLLLYIIFGCAATFSQVAPVGQKPKCHEFTGTVPVTSATICDSTEKTLGNGYNPVILDFSQSKKEAFDLLTRGFNKISGAFIMDGNEQVDTVNFASIIIFDGSNLGKDSLFISIRNNPNLEKFTWDKNVNQLQIFGDLGKDLFIYIYNNPQLEVDSLKMIVEALNRNTNIRRALQSGPNECRFQHPINSGSFETPPADVLKHCKNIEGDMKMDGGSLAGLSLTLGDGACLRLIGVDMTGTSISLRNGTLSPICKDNVTKSEIKNNKGLCGDDLVKLETAFSDPTVPIEMDVSCATTCTTTTQIGNKFVVCQTIDMANANISKWFTENDLKSKPAKLQKILKTVTIQRISQDTISLTGLKEVEHLQIIGNAALEKIDLGSPTKIDQLTITDNPLFTGFNQLTAITPKAAKVDCYLKGKAIQDLNAYRICTHFFGGLLLEGPQQAVDVHVLQGKTIGGCVTVKGTDLKSVDFLYKATITGCATEHLLEDNPGLCPIKMLGKVKVTATGTHRTQGCEKSCQSLAAGCVRLVNDLAILDSTKQQHLNSLQFLDGSLTMMDTKMRKLALPNLTQISSSKAPAMTIENNAELESIEMPKLTTIQAKDKGTPLAKFANNPKLSIPSRLSTTLGTCGSDPKGACYVQVNGSGGQENGNAIWFGIGGGSLLLLLLAGIAIFVILWKKGKLGKKKEEGSPKTPVKKPNKGGKADSNENGDMAVDDTQASSKDEGKTPTSTGTNMQEDKTQDSTKDEAKKPTSTAVNIQEDKTQASSKDEGKTPMSAETNKKDERKDDVKPDDYKLVPKVKITGTTGDNQMTAFMKSPQSAKTQAVLIKEHDVGRAAANADTDKWKREQFDKNKEKNRYNNVYAVDETLVQLPKSYIHANKVNGVGPNEKNKFICTQAPMKKTIADFWQMILQEGCILIIMLNNLVEGKNKCARYFPLDVNTPITLEIPATNMTVTIYLCFVKRLGNNIAHRRLKVEIAVVDQDNEERFLDHYQYEAWPDHSFPAVEDGLELFLLLQVINESWKEHHKTIVIHCFAGIGRTGCLVLLDFIMTKLGMGEMPNIPELLLSLRKQRAGCVQTAIQHVGIYVLVVEKAIEEGLIDREEKKDILADWKKPIPVIRETNGKNPPTWNGSRESTSKEHTSKGPKGSKKPTSKGPKGSKKPTGSKESVSKESVSPARAK